MSWTAPASNGGSPLTGYTVTSNPGGLSLALVPSATQTTVLGLTNGTAYTFTVIASNAVGNGPVSSPSNSVTPATVPSAPTSVAAARGNGQASVSWTAPTDNGGAAVTGYTVTASPGGLTATTTGATQLTFAGLTNGTSYVFTVVATNSAGDSAPSSPSNAVVPATLPGAPTAVSATAGPAQATVTWTAPASNGGTTITTYTVTSNPGGVTASTAGLSVVVTGLTDTVSYTFTVTATNSVGTGPASSASNAVTPLSPPGQPGTPTATTGNTQASVSWTAPASNEGSAITGYTVTASPGGQTASTAGLNATVTGLSNGTSYTFTVRATNAVGTGPASAASNAVTPATVPGAPRSVTAVPGSARATVTWAAPSSNGGAAITGYTVTSSPGGITASTAGLSTTVSGLTNGTHYTFTVTATNAAGTGPGSAASLAVMPTLPWTWKNPLPQGNTLNAAWGSGPSDVWHRMEQGLDGPDDRHRRVLGERAQRRVGGWLRDHLALERGCLGERRLPCCLP